MKLTQAASVGRIDGIVSIPILLLGLFLLGAGTVTWSLYLNHFIAFGGTVYILNQAFSSFGIYFTGIFVLTGSVLSFVSLKHIYRWMKPVSGKSKGARGAGRTLGTMIPLILVAMFLTSSVSTPVFATISTTQAAVVSSYSCDKSASIFIDTDGSSTYGIAGTAVTSAGCGTLLYGGPSNAGGISGSSATNVINAAIGALTSGGEIYVEAGTYSVTTLTVNQPVAIIGASIQGTVFSESAGTGNTFSVTGNNVTLSTFTITASTTRTGGDAISLAGTSADQDHVNNINIRKAFNGIQSSTSGVDFVTQIDMRGFASGGSGILLTGGNDQLFSNIEVDGTSTPYGGSAGTIVNCMEITNNAGFMITTSDFHACQTGILFEPSGKLAGTHPCIIDAATISDVWVDANTHSGVYFDSSNAGCTADPVFTSVWLVSNGLYGMVMVNVTAGQFSQLRVWNNGDSGIWLDNTVSGLTFNNLFTNSIISDNNQANNAAGCSGVGVCVGQYSGNFLFTNSRISNGLFITNTGHQTYAFYIYGGVASTNFEITGNDLRGNTVGAIDFGSSALGESITIVGNQGYTINPISTQGTAGTGSMWSSGSSPSIFTNGFFSTVDIVLKTANGITGWTCGIPVSLTAGTYACILTINSPMTVTWSVTAPVFAIEALDTW